MEQNSVPFHNSSRWIHWEPLLWGMLGTFMGLGLAFGVYMTYRNQVAINQLMTWAIAHAAQHKAEGK